MRHCLKRPTKIEYCAVGVTILLITMSALLIGERAATQASSGGENLPDYITESITLYPSPMETGRMYSIVASIRNLGPRKATHQTYAALSIDERNNGSWDVIGTRTITPPLAADASADNTWTSIGTSPTINWRAFPGTHRVRVCAAAPTGDPAFSLMETNAGNNCLDHIFLIGQETEDN